VSYPGTPSSFDASHPELVASLPPETLAVVHAELAAELRRRRREPAESERRRRKIAAEYRRLRPDAYRLDVDERLAALARIAREALRADPATAREKLLERAAAIGADGGGPTIRQRPAGVFSFPAFPARFRDALREEIAHFEASLPAIGVPVARPNTMNENGVLLAELPGMCEGVVDPLVREYVAPLSAALYGDAYYGGGGGGKKTCKTVSSSDGAADLDHHRAFTVAYGPGDRDVDLARHWDDAEVTINVNLGGAFEGGELVFGEVVSDETKRRLASASASGGGGGGGGEEEEEEEDERPVVVAPGGSGGSPPTAVRHRAGVAVLHRGAHSHEAAPTESGTRVNLVVWCRSSRRRREACAMCGRDKSESALGVRARRDRTRASRNE
jgi:hypothetical protein